MQKVSLLFLISSLFFCTNAQIKSKRAPPTHIEKFNPKNYKIILSIKQFGAKGDGVSNDSAAIQKAVNAAEVYRCCVFIPNGVYNISGPVIVWPYVRLFGQNKDSTIIQTINPTNALLVLTHTSVSNIHLRGLLNIATPTIAINSGSAEYVNIENNIIEYFSHGINTGGFSQYWNIQGNIVRNNRWDGIFVAARSNYNHIIENQVYGNGSNGIDVNSSFNTIAFNSVDSNGYAFAGLGYDGWGILISGIDAGLPGDANNNTVQKNWVRKSCMQNIIVRADVGHTANFNIISNNICIGSNTRTDPNSDGICIDGSSKGELRSNKIIRNIVLSQRRHGIAITSWNSFPEETIVTGNVIYNSTGFGLFLGGSRTKAQDNTYMYNLQGNFHSNP